MTLVAGGLGNDWSLKHLRLEHKLVFCRYSAGDRDVRAATNIIGGSKARVSFRGATKIVAGAQDLHFVANAVAYC